MEKRPQLSVIVPVYKVEPYLQRCIDSVLAQTFRDLELILVDDGSPDNCPAICDAAAEKDERVVVLHRKNAGLSAARNAGLSAARGDYIGFVDSDDYIAPEMYQTLYDAAEKNGAQLALCGYAYVDEAGRECGSRKPPFEKAEVLDREQAMARLGGEKEWYYITAWNRLYRRELFENIRFPLGRIHEDEYVVHHIFWACQRIAIVPELLYFYVQREGSIMQTKTFKSCMDKAEGLFDRFDFAQEQGLDYLAFRSCTKLLRFLMEVRTGKIKTEGADKDTRKREWARAKGRLWGMLWAPRREKYKLGVGLYLLSPRLYGLMVELKDSAKKKGGR